MSTYRLSGTATVLFLIATTVYGQALVPQTQTFGVNYLLTPAEAKSFGLKGKQLQFAGQLAIESSTLDVRSNDKNDKQHQGKVIFSLPLASIQDVTPFTQRVQTNQLSISLTELANSLGQHQQVAAPIYDFWEFITVLAELPQGIVTHTFHVRTGETATIVATIKFAAKKAQGGDQSTTTSKPPTDPN